ncbi:site-2 protease family protein [Candidatus Peregrinibacteria bacterium]|nr:site-2 protease family protein [Candidatus Peregrinibacteria bacterium]
MTIINFVFLLASLVFVITVHEYAHAWMANFLGDPTAKNQGRISLNPLRHLDPMGTLLIFLAGIGWGKPVPVNPFYFKNRKVYEAAVALAGPMMNLIVAVIVLIPLKYFGDSLGIYLETLLFTIFDISILLFAFNMLPFAPLDGSKVVGIIIPDKWQGKYQEFLANSAMYFFVFLLVDHFILTRYFGFSILSFIIGWIVTLTKTVLFLGT